MRSVAEGPLTFHGSTRRSSSRKRTWSRLLTRSRRTGCRTTGSTSCRTPTGRGCRRVSPRSEDPEKTLARSRGANSLTPGLQNSVERIVGCRSHTISFCTRVCLEFVSNRVFHRLVRQGRMNPVRLVGSLLVTSFCEETRGRRTT